MGTMRFDIEKFSGKSDFGLWSIKMRAIIVQQGLVKALKKKEKMSTTLTEKERIEMMEKAQSAIILCLGDKVLREVSKETTAAGMWLKLESLYMAKSLANRLCMKQKLYSFKILDDKNVTDQVDQFIKKLDDLENIDIKL